MGGFKKREEVSLLSKNNYFYIIVNNKINKHGAQTMCCTTA